MDDTVPIEAEVPAPELVIPATEGGFVRGWDDARGIDGSRARKSRPTSGRAVILLASA